jgi:hypothetical protein
MPFSWSKAPIALASFLAYSDVEGRTLNSLANLSSIRASAGLTSFKGSANVSSFDICDKYREKRDDTRSISMMNTMDLDWFSPSHKVIVIRLIFVVLWYKIQYPWWIVGCYWYSQEHCLIDTAMFPTLLQFHKHPDQDFTLDRI